VSIPPRASSGRVIVPGSERVAPPGAAVVGRADSNERTSVTVMLRPRRSSAAKAAALAAVPPRRRAYLTRDAFAEAHGADPGDVLAVERFAVASGVLVLAADLARRSVTLEGTLVDLSTAFGAKLVLFRLGDQTFRGRTGPLTVPASLRDVVVGVFGLDERPQARAQFRRSARAAAATSVSYTPLQVATAYDFPKGLDGTGQTIALIELDGGYTEADLTAYFAELSLAKPNVVSVAVDGATNAPTGDPNSADTEVMLDIEVAGAVAPGANIVVYFAPNTDQGFLDAITTAIHDTVNHPTILSISWGAAESTWTAQAMSNFDAAFADAATLGISVCVASGDNGSSDGATDALAHVDFPSSSSHVLACGGTTLKASGATITSETVWNDGAQGGATGGGVSDVFAVASWQKSAGVPPSANPGGHVGRGVPDVAGDADPNTGYTTRVDGFEGAVGGTSAVAPLWAGLLARVNQSVGKPVGFVNALLYAAREGPFRDVTSGNNGSYSAKVGWDACTGLGSPDGAKVLAILAGG
jgi:kumamolisin